MINMVIKSLVDVKNCYRKNWGRQFNHLPQIQLETELIIIINHLINIFFRHNGAFKSILLFQTRTSFIRLKILMVQKSIIYFAHSFLFWKQFSIVKINQMLGSQYARVSIFSMKKTYYHKLKTFPVNF